MERLDKVLSEDGRWSRKEIKSIVKSGRVAVDGIVIKQPEYKISREAHVLVDGEEIANCEFTYLMMNKPIGVLSATEDKRQETVINLLEKKLQHRNLFPVGRLDKDTVGLLLLTNDGELAHKLLSPKYHVDKTYLAEFLKPLDDSAVQLFSDGIVIDDEVKCLPAKLELFNSGKQGRITIREGKFHQIKRMVHACGSEVVFLKRISMGTLELDPALAEGEYRYLSDVEISALQM